MCNPSITPIFPNFNSISFYRQTHSLALLSSSPPPASQQTRLYRLFVLTLLFFLFTLGTDLGRRLAKQSSLAKLAMNNHLASSPPNSLSPTTSEPDQPLAVQKHKKDVVFAQLPPPATAMASVVRAMNDLTETPTFPRSVPSTAPSSPRMYVCLLSSRLFKH